MTSDVNFLTLGLGTAGRVRKTPVISLAAMTGLIGAITTGGGDPDQVLRSCGLSRRDVSNPHGFVAWSLFARLLETAAQATGDACFGLHFGEHYNPKNVGPVTYLVLNSPTFAVGFETLARYLNAHNEGGRVSFAIEGDWAYLRYEITDPSIESPRQASEYSMAVGRNTIRLMAGSQWAPVEVQFAHPAPADVAEHTRVFGAPVSFGCPTNAFVIAREFVDRQVPSADEHLYPVLKRYLDRVLAEMPREDDLLASTPTGGRGVAARRRPEPCAGRAEARDGPAHAAETPEGAGRRLQVAGRRHAAALLA